MLPATTGSGESTTLVDRLAEAETVVVAVPVLLAGVGSPLPEEMVAELLSSVPAATDELTLTTRVKAELVVAKEGLLQLIAPPAPTAGVVQLHPAAALSEAKVVPAGKVSIHVAEPAASGPALVIVIV